MAETPESQRRVPEGFGAETSRQMQDVITANQALKTDAERQAQRDREQKEHNERAMRNITLWGVLVSLIAAGVGGWAAYEAHQTRISDERPFVGVELPATPARSYPVLKTLGKSPSVNVRVLCETVQTEEQINWSSVQQKPSSTHEYRYFLPNDSQEFLCAVPDGLKVEAGLGGDVRYVYGLVTYDQDTGEHHRTPFCFRRMLSPDGKTVDIDHCGFAENNEPEIQ